MTLGAGIWRVQCCAVLRLCSFWALVVCKRGVRPVVWHTDRRALSGALKGAMCLVRFVRIVCVPD